MTLLPSQTIHYSDKFALVKSVAAIERILPEPGTDITYFCIGSDLSTGDCFGPLTGTLLKNIGFKNIIGSLDETVHAGNLEEKLLLVPKDSFIVAVDAMMGHYKELGNLSFFKGPIKPGAAFNRELPPVGEASVVLNVAPSGFANFLVLGSCSLNKIWQGANLLARTINLVSYRRKKHRLELPVG
ncbi:MAG: spore protease YyaC [Bacillota bacterium]